MDDVGAGSRRIGNGNAMELFASYGLMLFGAPLYDTSNANGLIFEMIFASNDRRREMVS